MVAVVVVLLVLVPGLLVLVLVPLLVVRLFVRSMASSNTEHGEGAELA